MAYKWYLELTPIAQAQINALPQNDRMLMFSKLIELLNADEPTNPNQVTDIKKLKSPEYRGLWRKRSGNWRILYRLEEGEVIFFKFRYKGTLVIEQVVNRRDL
ncbi:MAG: hypothetical protein L0154_21250 [Chloroflexi bacterium]|nr:hypothetical protein [Chloroflexota bacterium]